MRHILNVGGDTDRRMRMGGMRIKKRANSRTLCGAAIGEHVTSRDTAAHALKYKTLKPEWSADLCADCVSKLNGVTNEQTN